MVVSGARRRRLPGGDGVDWLLMVAGSLVVAAVTLVVLPRAVAYDAWSWLIWGREIAHLDLDTRHAATAVKPLPIFVGTVLAPAGAATPMLWLLLARAGALLSIALAFRVGRYLGGVLAGVVAAVCLALANQLASYLFVRGMSEPMATAAVLAAVDTHVRGHRRAALAFLCVAGLLRPEVWPAVIGYCVWLMFHAGAIRRVALACLAVAVPAVWFLIDWFGARQLSRSADAATHQSQGGPLLSRVPGLATVTETWQLMSGVVLVLFVLGFVTGLLAWRRSGRPGPAVWLGLGALGWLLQDAVLAQGRLATGAPRYLLPGAGLACVVAGLFVAQLVGVLQRRFGGSRLRWAVVPAVVLVLVVASAGRALYIARATRDGIEASHLMAARQHHLDGAIASAGGRAAVLQCGTVGTGTFDVPLVAWKLDVPIERVRVAAPGVTGTVIEPWPSSLPRAVQSHYYRVPNPRTPGHWVVLTPCIAPQSRSTG